jgi:hypothetical protein
MTKQELLRALEPFDDDTFIAVELLTADRKPLELPISTVDVKKMTLTRDAYLTLRVQQFFKVGDIVQNWFGPDSTRGCPLVCGSGYYEDAIVVSVEPFVLVSREGDMLWACIRESERHYLKVIGPATDEESKKAFARFENDRRRRSHAQES